MTYALPSGTMRTLVGTKMRLGLIAEYSRYSRYKENLEMTPYHHHEQQKSKTIRHGPGKYHDKAQERMVNMLDSAGWDVYPDAKFGCSWYFDSQHGNPLGGSPNHLVTDARGYRHEYDIYAEKKHKNGLTSKLCLEIDGKKHNSAEQQRRDREAERYARFFIYDVRIIRMPIDLLLNLAISDDTIMKEYKLT